MMILTLLLSLAVLALFVQSSSAWSDKRRVDISKGGRRAASNDVRSRGKSGDFKSEGKHTDNHKSSYSAQQNAAVSVEDEENRFQHNQNTHAVQDLVVGLESTDNRFSFEETSTRLNLKGGAWRSQKADGSIEYMAFENMFTYKRVVREASGATNCGNHVFNQRHKNKNPSILYSSYHGDIPRATLIHKSTDNMFIQEFVYNDYNVSWTREDSIPSDFRCFTASYVVAEEGIGQMEREPLTWMGQDIGLYGGADRDNDPMNLSPDLTVISELDGYTKTFINDFFPQNSQFHYVVASYNNIFWTICYCGDNNELMQSNSNTPISFDFEIGGATALSESVLFIVDENNGRIVKYDLVSNQILATSSGYVEAQDIAISLDKQYVYYADYDVIIALNAADLSVYRTYSFPQPNDREFEFGSIEVTPTNMWIVVTDWDVEQSYLARVTLNDN
jgi:hypothetical protein